MTEPGTPTIIEEPARVTAVVRGTSPMSEIGQFFDSAFQRLGAELDRQGVQPQAAPFALYHGAPTDVADLEVGVVTAAPIEAAGGVTVSSLPAGQVAHVIHAGSFDGLGGAWHALIEFATGRGLTPGASMWEVYLTEPSPDMDPAELRTALYLPVS